MNLLKKIRDWLFGQPANEAIDDTAMDVPKHDAVQRSAHQRAKLPKDHIDYLPPKRHKG